MSCEQWAMRSFDISIELGRPNSILMFFYITVQRDGHAELVSASHCEPLFTPFPRWDPELKLTLFNLLTLGIPNQAWLCSRLTANFRMTLGDSCYFYTHFGASNSIILSKTLITHRSSLNAQMRLWRREARRANSRGFLNPWKKREE